MAIISNGTILNTLGYKLPDGVEITSIDDLKYIDNSGNLTQLANNIFTALINKVGATYINSRKWKSPFSKFIKDKLDYAVIIEDIYVDMPQGKKWDTSVDAMEFVDRGASPVVKATYKDLNYQSYYKVCWTQREIARAFKSRTGLNNLFESVMNSVANRIETDLYNYTIATLSTEDAYTTNQVVSIAKPVDSATAKAYLMKVAEYVKKFTRPSNAYNSLATDSVSDKDNLTLVVRDDVLRAVDFDFLSGVFNLEKVGVGVDNIISIETFGLTDEDTPTDLKANDNILAVLMDNEALFISPTYELTTSFNNGVGRFTNTIVNKDYNIGFRLGFNRVMFKVPTTSQE